MRRVIEWWHYTYFAFHRSKWTMVLNSGHHFCFSELIECLWIEKNFKFRIIYNRKCRLQYQTFCRGHIMLVIIIAVKVQSRPPVYPRKLHHRLIINFTRAVFVVSVMRCLCTFSQDCPSPLKQNHNITTAMVQEEYSETITEWITGRTK